MFTWWESNNSCNERLQNIQWRYQYALLFAWFWWGHFSTTRLVFLSFCQALLFWQRSVSKGFEILYCLMLFVKYCRPTDSTQELWNYLVDPIPRQGFIMDVRLLVCIPDVLHVFHWFPMRLRHVWGSWLLPWGFVVFFFPLTKSNWKPVWTENCRVGKSQSFCIRDSVRENMAFSNWRHWWHRMFFNFRSWRTDTGFSRDEIRLDGWG